MANKSITVLAVTNRNYHDHCIAVNRTADCLPKEVKADRLIISPDQPPSIPSTPDVPWHRIDPQKLNGIKVYMTFLVAGLADIITTDFALLVHWDGFAVNPHRWHPEFLDYDYIGPPWPRFMTRDTPRQARVGNGGFALRSRRWLETGKAIGYPDTAGTPNEDEFLCNSNTGCRIAPLDLAASWAIENPIEEYPKRSIADCFGFHDFLHRGHRHLRISPATARQKFDCFIRGLPVFMRLRWRWLSRDFTIKGK
jgi:hypothetical protein